MRKRGLFIAIGLAIAVNAIVLAGAAYNRSGEPEAVMMLTERELPIGHSYQKENSGVALTINTHHDFYGGLAPVTHDAFAWLDREKLETLGFDFSAPSSADNNDYYNKQLPRRAYAVLEYDGRASGGWQKKLSDELAKVDQAEKEGTKTTQELQAARKNIEEALRTSSHLFIVDAGTDSSALRKQYSDRRHYLILPATIRISYVSYPVTSKADVRGYVDILTSEVNVPHRLHAKLGEQKKQGSRFRKGMGMPESGPRYQVVLHTGRRYEPWIEDVIAIP